MASGCSPTERGFEWLPSNSVLWLHILRLEWLSLGMKGVPTLLPTSVYVHAYVRTYVRTPDYALYLYPLALHTPLLHVLQHR